MGSSPIAGIKLKGIVYKLFLFLFISMGLDPKRSPRICLTFRIFDHEPTSTISFIDRVQQQKVYFVAVNVPSESIGPPDCSP